MESLWQQRLEDLTVRRPELTVADLENRRTHEANHNAARLEVLFCANSDKPGQSWYGNWRPPRKTSWDSQPCIPG